MGNILLSTKHGSLSTKNKWMTTLASSLLPNDKAAIELLLIKVQDVLIR
jgi:hypothetical protein